MNWGILIVIGIIVIILEVASQSVRNKKTNEKLQQSKNLSVDKTNTVDVEEEKEENISVDDYKSYKKKYLFTKNEFYFYKQLQKIAESKIYFLLQSQTCRFCRS